MASKVAPPISAKVHDTLHTGSCWPPGHTRTNAAIDKTHEVAIAAIDSQMSLFRSARDSGNSSTKARAGRAGMRRTQSMLYPFSSDRLVTSLVRERR